MLEDTGTFHPALLNKPTLRDDCLRYYEAFRQLGVRRLWSQVGPQPIQLTEIEALLKMLDISDPGTRLKYVRLIGRLDEVERSFLAQQMKSTYQD